MTPIVKICAFAESAGISVIPHAGGNTAYGQHACYAMPAIPWTETFVASPPGVAPEDAAKIPGLSTPTNGTMKPSDAPGFGLEIEQHHLSAFKY